MRTLARAALVCASSAVFAVGLAATGGAAFAANPHSGTTGQPGKSCEEQPTTPGNSVNAPGSPFNPNGQAGTVYAGEQPQNSKNAKSVSQYDVACFQQSQ